MSRIGKRPINLPDGINIEYIENKITVKGKKGVLALDLPEYIVISKTDKAVSVEVDEAMKDKSRLLGLYRALVANLVNGVNEGYRKDLELVGVGYRVQLQGKNLVMTLGYSHEIKYEAPEGIEFKVEGQNKIAIIGIDKCLVGQIAANICAFKKPDAYKGKGIRRVGQIVKTKPGKSVKK